MPVILCLKANTLTCRSSSQFGYYDQTICYHTSKDKICVTFSHLEVMHLNKSIAIEPLAESQSPHGHIELREPKQLCAHLWLMLPKMCPTSSIHPSPNSAAWKALQQKHKNFSFYTVCFTCTAKPNVTLPSCFGGKQGQSHMSLLMWHEAVAIKVRKSPKQCIDLIGLNWNEPFNIV